MVEHIQQLWTILCRDVTSDERGSLSLVGLMDMIHLRQLPQDGGVPFRRCLVAYWRRNLDPGMSIHQRISYRYDEDGRRWVLPDTEQRVVLVNRHLYCVITRLESVPIGGYGQHMFIVQRRDSEAGEWVDAPLTAGLWVASDAMVGALQPVE